MIRLQELADNDFVLCPESNDLGAVITYAFHENKKFVIALQDDKILAVHHIDNLLKDFFEIDQSFIRSRNEKLKLANIESKLSFSLINENTCNLPGIKTIATDIAVIINDDGFPTGLISSLKPIQKLLENFDSRMVEIKDTLLEYEKIFETIEEEIFVTDQNGYILRLNPAAEKVCGVKSGEVTGRHVTELEREGIISSSITMPVLHQKKKVNMIQQLKSGKKILSTAVPIFNDDGEIVRVISTSKDFEEINRLRIEIEEKKTELERKNQELTLLREEIFSSVNFIFNSKEMRYVRDTISKIAPLDLTILIQGESGVGKEVVTKTIHYLSPRQDQPFIKINCSLIPENLIESELFGYESGAFTGATKGGKIGKIELANNGTLFLDEIGEVPLMIQVKLLEFLQDREICRVGGNNKIKINTRVIAATNRSLQDMVKEGLFRKDLYYRLNVVPINVPPLRERKEDIPVLVNYFLNYFNNKYGINKKIAPEVMQAFYNYNWPGNVRELEHVIERAMVINESEVITIDSLQYILEIKPNQKKVICTDLMPLKQAKKELEEQLVKSAYELYKSTYKVAKVLEVDQSTIVKLLKKYK